MNDVQWQIIRYLLVGILFCIVLYKEIKDKRTRLKDIDKIRRRYKEITGEEID